MIFGETVRNKVKEGWRLGDKKSDSFHHFCMHAVYVYKQFMRFQGKNSSLNFKNFIIK